MNNPMTDSSHTVFRHALKLRNMLSYFLQLHLV